MEPFGRGRHAFQIDVLTAVFADVVPVFNPPGGEARSSAICMLTLLCAAGDSHPSDAGYRAMAEVVFDASGYGRLGSRERS